MTNNTCLERHLRVIRTLVDGNETGNQTINDSVSRHMNTQWLEFVIPIISFLGVLGNILNLVILTRQRILSSMDRLERSATYGLAALALSDMMVCISVLPHAFITYPHTFTVNGAHLFALYYKVYGIALLNTFMTTSTWLILVLAFSRYLVVVYPLTARYSVTVTKTTCAVIFTYVFSVVVSLPHFLHLRIAPCDNPQQLDVLEIQDISQSRLRAQLQFYIRWVWQVFAYFIPILVLVFCNTRLICELRQAKVFRRNSCHVRTTQARHDRVTLTLVIIFLMLLVLVVPAEIIRYFKPFGRSWGKVGYMVVYAMNVLQIVNFAVNFILYCALNRHFRHAICDIICGCSRKPRDHVTTVETLPLDNTTLHDLEAKSLHKKNSPIANGFETYL